MPHLHIDYTANLDPHCDIGTLCRALAAAMATMADDTRQPVFPLAGTRVLAYPAPHHAVADGQPQHAFVYLNLRITPGRAPHVVQAAGEGLLEVARSHFAQFPLAGELALTLHIDEVSPVYEGRYRP